MRRIKAAIVVLALLATPLALLARAVACENCACAMMCCAPHTQHGKGMLCGGTTRGHATQCGMKHGKQLPDFGLLAPMAPTVPLTPARLTSPDVTRHASVPFVQLAQSGFLAAPFQPPRS
jgi:hypothetical protein